MELKTKRKIQQLSSAVFAVIGIVAIYSVNNIIGAGVLCIAMAYLIGEIDLEKKGSD
jgi:hypothetical protein